MTPTDDVRIGRLAELGALVGVVGLVTLGLMFAIEVPRDGPFVFGTINDLCGAALNALFIPVALRIGRDAGDEGLFGLATRAAIVAAVAGTVLPLLLVGGVLPFALQAPLVVACIEVQSLWLVALGGRLAGVAGRERLGRISRLVGGSFLAGSALFGVGFAAPDGAPLRVAAWVAGGVIGVGGYVGWPYWFHAVGRALRRASTAAPAAELAWTKP